MSDKISLNFLRDHGKYVEGDIASFEPALAKSIVDAGAARRTDGAADARPMMVNVDASGVSDVLAAHKAELELREAALYQKAIDQQAAFDRQAADLDAKFAEKMAELAAATASAAVDVATVSDAPVEDVPVDGAKEGEPKQPKEVGAPPKQGKQK